MRHCARMNRAATAETDLDGHARVLCDRLDMGAFEFGIGDYDCDGVVGLANFATWRACATGPNGVLNDDACRSFDFDADHDTDLRDWALLELILTAP